MEAFSLFKGGYYNAANQKGIKCETTCYIPFIFLYDSDVRSFGCGHLGTYKYHNNRLNYLTSYEYVLYSTLLDTLKLTVSRELTLLLFFDQINLEPYFTIDLTDSVALLTLQ